MHATQSAEIGRAAGVSAPARKTATGAPVVALVCLGIFMTTLDASIVNIGLPSIARAFDTPLDGALEWIIICYLVVIGGLLLTFGRLSDIIGRSPIWLSGLIVFTAGSAVCGAAPSLALLIVARALQGIGGAMILSTSTALLSGAVPPARRGHALGWGAVSVALGASAGPTIGGLLTAYASWRWIFYVNVPIGLVAILATLRLIPPIIEHKQERFDPAGAALLAVALASLNLGLSFAQEWGWTSMRVLGILSLGTASLVAGVFVEARSTHPIIDIRLFRNRVFVSAVVSLLCSMLALFAVGFLLPFYAEELRGFTPERTGLLLTPFPVPMALVSPVAGSLADRVGSRWLAPLAMAITAVGLLLLTQLDTTTSLLSISWRLALAGVGVGLFQAPNTRALMGAAPESQQGMASGVFATTRVTGQALSIAVAGAVFASVGGAAAGSALSARGLHLSVTADAGRHALEVATFLHGFRAALATCAAFAALGALAALLRGPEHATHPSSLPVRRMMRPLALVAVGTLAAIPAARHVIGRTTETFRQPSVVASRGGVLRLSLIPELATVEVAGRQVALMAYDGEYTPPTLRVHPGDTIRLRFPNRLAQPTNLHFHGMAVSPRGNSDNPFLHIAPGSTVDYEVRIPLNHAPGLFWYHPHPHGLSDMQTRNGMAGALIVEGLLDSFPTLRQVRERVLLLKDLQAENGRVVHMEIGENMVRTINGVERPVIVLRPGETELWRIANVSADVYYQLSLEGHRFDVVARDGHRLARIEAADTLVLSPGARVEALVTGGVPGVHLLRDGDIDTGPSGNQYAGTVMATVRVEGSPATPAALPAALLPVEDLRPRVTNRRTIVFTESSDGDTFFIDGKTFGMKRTDTRVALGAVEEWTIRNDSDELHSFHIHQAPFQITEINGVAQAATGYRDVVDVPIRGAVKVVIPFTNPVIVGRFVYHCHILSHEDKGMMATIAVTR